MKPIPLRRLLGAAESRQVVLPGELSGYLVLFSLEMGRLQGCELNTSTVALASDGRVVFTEERPAEEGSESPRLLLQRLLAVSSAVSPPLWRVLQGVKEDWPSVIRELEAALVPLNRSAARRALARLHRELARPGHSRKESQAKPVESLAQPLPLDQGAMVVSNAPVPAPVEPLAVLTPSSVPLSTTLVIATVAPVRPELPHDPRTTTLVIAEVAPIESPAALPEPTMALPLITRRTETAEGLLRDSEDEKTSVDAIVSLFEAEAEAELDVVEVEAEAELDVVEVEAEAELDVVEVEAEAELDVVEAEAEAELDVVEAEAEAELDVVEAEAEAELDVVEVEAEAELDVVEAEALLFTPEPIAPVAPSATSDETVMPLGSYELSYPGSSPTSAELDREGFLVTPEPCVAYAEPVRSQLRTFYRDEAIAMRTVRSDVDLLAASLAGGDSIEEHELCRGLRAVAGIALTPALPRVEVARSSTESPAELPCVAASTARAR